jgi:hypothetical protein
MNMQKNDLRWLLFVLVLGVFALMVSVAPASAILAERCAINACPTCDCYWSSECGSGKTCNYSSGCTKSGKLDGTCTAGSVVVIANPNQMASSLSYWFDAYIATAEAGTDGLPDSLLVDQAAQTGLSQEALNLVRDEVINSLDILLGFDVVIPRGNCLAYDPRCLAQYRIPIEQQGIDLLTVSKSALVNAILTGNPSVVDTALNSYWSGSTFEPHHTGRCYPHGHAEQTITPLTCQKDELRRIANILITSTQTRSTFRVLRDQ